MEDFGEERILSLTSGKLSRRRIQTEMEECSSSKRYLQSYPNVSVQTAANPGTDILERKSV